MLSQSGRRKQDYGPKVNFKRRRVAYGRFTGLPAYCRFLVDRINQTVLNHPRLQHSAFHPVELCNLEYNPDRGACIVPHLDDVWLWGDRLITLNLCSSTVLTFSLPDNESPQVAEEFKRVRSILDLEHGVQRPTDVAVRVSLERRSLIIVDGPARYIWFHAILRSDIQSRRIAMTFRELSQGFLPPNESDEDSAEDQLLGRKLLDIAQTYQGSVCSVD
ncbi:Alkylated DNA repair protein alkB like protein 4 [Paragonimus westermani]|uniref:Alkylated DNA repair protein alkB like protein 4 n=1 Tax=Paragonimus westermani TaxID=34504 RepID=A0A8T0D790_9TREM|nr:Alkylated DNA repair protein alkB like protein 4 [Paragonimus westermani]